MDSKNLHSGSVVSSTELRLLAGVEPRILRITIALALLGTAGFGMWQGIGWAAGFAIGAALSAVNFHWMTRAVHSLTAPTYRGGNPLAAARGRPGEMRAVFRFVLRYALIGTAGYAIFKISPVSLTAFLVGLFASVAATLGEMGYEIYRGLREG